MGLELGSVAYRHSRLRIVVNRCDRTVGRYIDFGECVINKVRHECGPRGDVLPLLGQTGVLLSLAKHIEHLHLSLACGVRLPSLELVFIEVDNLLELVCSAC